MNFLVRMKTKDGVKPRLDIEAPVSSYDAENACMRAYAEQKIQLMGVKYEDIDFDANKQGPKA